MLMPRKSLLAILFVSVVLIIKIFRPNGSLSSSQVTINTDGNAFAHNSLWTVLQLPSTKATSAMQLQQLSTTQTELSHHPAQTYHRAMVVPRMKDDDISWMSEHLPDLNATIYLADDPGASFHPPKNKGHEVMIYLTFIIDQYDQLPDVVLFMHAHRFTHHNSELLGFDAVQMVQRLNDDYVLRQGYVNMRCDWDPGCPEWLHPDDVQETMGKQEQVVLSQTWHELFPYDPLPEALGQACCAQFALSKERIMAVPRSRYIYFRDWIMRTPLSDYISGRIWEYSWQYLFTHQSVFCPTVHTCHCAGFGVCFGGQEKFHEYENLQNTKQGYQSELETMFKEAQESIVDNAVQDASYNRTAAILKDAKFSSLNNRVGALDKELKARKHAAIERGDNPQHQLEEVHSTQGDDGAY